MDGYFRNERASAEVLSDGWLRTGDLGFVDRGRLFVTGRAKDVIIQGGRNVHAPDVERVAFEACGSGAATIAAFARANSTRGTDDLVVLVETSVRDEAQRAAMAKAVRGEVLAALGVRVDEVRLCAVGSAPRTTSGKVRRSACAAIFQERGS
jgi:acyl-CoA synthetase (AMP-forming)/AMP-acid ligase II